MMIIQCPYCGADNYVKEDEDGGGYTFVCVACITEVYVAK